MTDVSMSFFAAYLHLLENTLGDRMVSPEMLEKLRDLAAQTEELWFSLPEVPEDLC